MKPVRRVKVGLVSDDWWVPDVGLRFSYQKHWQRKRDPNLLDK